MAEIKKIIGVGMSGLVGTGIQDELVGRFDIVNLSSDTGVDITDPSTLSPIVKEKEASVLLHLAAKADVDGCEEDIEQGQNGAAWKINVDGTKNVLEMAKQNPNIKRFIFISTDFVFEGGSWQEGGYTERDVPAPVNFYGETKYQAEELVKNSGFPYLIMRIAYPYGTEFPIKKDFARSLIDRLKNGQEINAVEDHMMTPTFIPNIAEALEVLIATEETGIYHVVGSEFISPYDAAMTLASRFGFDSSLIHKTTRAEYFKNRAPRPFNLSLNNDRIEQLGLRMKRFDEGIRALKSYASE